MAFAYLQNWSRLSLVAALRAGDIIHSGLSWGEAFAALVRNGRLIHRRQGRCLLDFVVEGDTWVPISSSDGEDVISQQIVRTSPDNPGTLRLSAGGVDGQVVVYVYSGIGSGLTETLTLVLADTVGVYDKYQDVTLTGNTLYYVIVTFEPAEESSELHFYRLEEVWEDPT
jgi:hypothetical protein